MIDCVVAPFDQTLSVADDEVKTTLSPLQNIVAPEAVIDGVEGIGFTTTLVEAETPEAQPAVVTSTE